MTANSDTVARILDGALSALARRGVRKLSMSDVGDEARLSRGTLYRYFKNKDQLLGAVAGHVEQAMQQTLRDSVAQRPELSERVEVVVAAIVDFGRTHPEAVQIISVEPGFGVDFVRQVFPEFIAVTEELLAPALESSPAVRSGALSSHELSELILRAASSTFFVPVDDAVEVTRMIAALPALDSELIGN